MTNIEIQNIELAPVAGFDIETTSIYERVADRAMAALKAKSNPFAHKNAPEADGFFQRAMNFITGFGKAAPETFTPNDDAPCGDQEAYYIRTFTDCSAVLRMMLGRDYETPTITNPRQLRCIFYLWQAPVGVGISREDLDIQTGTTNSPEYVRIIRKEKFQQFGQLIEQERRKVVSNGKTTRRGYYWMTDIGRLIAHDVLAKAGYVHDVRTSERLARRMQMDRHRLIAAFGDDYDAKAAVLDATKPHWVRLVNLLLWKKDWISRYDIERLIDASNPPDVVANLNQNCDDEVIEAATRQLLDRDGNVCEIGCYRISPAWIAKMQAAVQDAKLAK